MTQKTNEENPSGCPAQCPVYVSYLQVSEPVTLTGEQTGIYEMRNVEIKSLNGEKFQVSTSSGAFSFNASNIIVNDVELIDLTISTLKSSVSVYVRLS